MRFLFRATRYGRPASGAWHLPAWAPSLAPLCGWAPSVRRMNRAGSDGYAYEYHHVGDDANYPNDGPLPDCDWVCSRCEKEARRLADTIEAAKR